MAIARSLAMPSRHQWWKSTHGSATAEPVAEVCADKDTGKSDSREQKLPLSGLLDVAVVDDTGNDRAREHAVREGDLSDWYSAGAENTG